jgi:sulfur carrier protein
LFGGQTVQIKVNGTVEELPDSSTIKDVLAGRLIPEDLVIVLLNGEIIKREEWRRSIVRPDDNLEIIRVVGGG